MIYSYGKRRSIRYRAEKEARKRVETRDAILWEVLPDQRVCRIKIQGSDALIPAYYPENWTSTPRWLKPGNAVRVTHVGGKRNRIEVSGDGSTVPTPVPGGSATPPIGTGQNAILSGLNVFAFSGMAVSVYSGTYRINDVVYTFTVSGITMGVAPVPVMGVAPVPVMGAGYTMLSVPAAHATMYRMDLICIGVDGVLDYITGTPDATNPLVPDLPSAHVQVATILVPPAATTIEQWFINRPWVAPFVSQIEAVATLPQLTWTDDDTTIAVRVLDQYGAPMPTSYQVLASITSGTGTISPASSYVNGSSNFTYRRMTDYDVYPYPGERCPVFIQFTLAINPSIQMLVPLLLENELGGLIV